MPRPQGAACDIGAYEAVVCGDGTVGPGEECEPGQGCCTDECLFADAGSSCDDGDPDTVDDQCTGNGAVCEGIPEDLEGDGGCSLHRGDIEPLVNVMSIAQTKDISHATVLQHVAVALPLGMTPGMKTRRRFFGLDDDNISRQMRVERAF